MGFIPNKIQIDPGTIPADKSLYIGDVYLGVDTYQTYGPTSTTNWYNGYSVPGTGYVTYLNKGLIEPSIYRCNNDSDLIENVQQVFGYTPPNIQEALNYYFNEASNICVNFDYDDLDCEDLQLMVDFGFTPCYPRMGSTVKNLGKKQGTGTLVNSYSWDGFGINNQKGEITVNNTGTKNAGLNIDAPVGNSYSIKTLSIWCMQSSNQVSFPAFLFECDGNTPDLYLDNIGPGNGFNSLGAQISVDNGGFVTLNNVSQYQILDDNIHNIVIRFTNAPATGIDNIAFLNNLSYNGSGTIGKILAVFAWDKTFTDDDVSRHYNALAFRLA